jgi:putative sigma-54 modulation protein
MNISMVGRHVELTDGIKAHIETGIESLKKYKLKIISVRAIIAVEEKKGLKTISIEFTITIAHKNSIVIKQKDKDLYVAIDTAIDRAHKVLSREHEKIKDHKKEGLEASTYKHIVSIEKVDDEKDDEILPQELELYKPIEIAEALQRLKDSDQQFFVFYDQEDKMRVIYKISENKFGLY